MHKTRICVLSLWQVLHAQDTHLCPVIRASSPWIRHSFMSCPKDNFSWTRHSLMLSSGQVIHAQRHSCMFCPKDKFSMHKTLIYVLSSGQVIHSQDIHLCSVLRTSSPSTRHSFMFCPKCKFSMHKAFIYVLFLRTSSPYNTLVYVLSWGHVLHAQGTRLYPVLRTSSPRTRHYFMSCAKGKFSMHKALSYVPS